MIAGISKCYNLPFDYVLYKMSFANVQLYNAVIPTFSPKKDPGTKGDDSTTINGDDPANQEAIRKALFDENEE